MATLEVLESRLDKHEEEIEKLWASNATKMSFKLFQWVIGISITISIAAFTYTFTNVMAQIKELDIKISEINKNSAAIQSSVSYLQGQWIQWTKDPIK